MNKEISDFVMACLPCAAAIASISVVGMICYYNVHRQYKVTQEFKNLRDDYNPSSMGAKQFDELSARIGQLRDNTYPFMDEWGEMVNFMKQITSDKVTYCGYSD